MEWVGLNAITMYFGMLKCHFSVNITSGRTGRSDGSAIARVWVVDLSIVFFYLFPVSVRDLAWPGLGVELS
jgi:hypothetical protein